MHSINCSAVALSTPGCENLACTTSRNVQGSLQLECQYGRFEQPQRMLVRTITTHAPYATDCAYEQRSAQQQQAPCMNKGNACTFTMHCRVLPSVLWVDKPNRGAPGCVHRLSRCSRLVPRCCHFRCCGLHLCPLRVKPFPPCFLLHLVSLKLHSAAIV